MHERYAYIAPLKTCLYCGKDHYYLTNRHTIITGSKEEINRIGLGAFKIERYDKSKSDIKKTENIFKIWPELNYARKKHSKR